MSVLLGYKNKRINNNINITYIKNRLNIVYSVFEMYDEGTVEIDYINVQSGQTSPPPINI